MGIATGLVHRGLLADLLVGLPDEPLSTKVEPKTWTASMDSLCAVVLLVKLCVDVLPYGRPSVLSELIVVVGNSRVAKRFALGIWSRPEVSTDAALVNQQVWR